MYNASNVGCYGDGAFGHKHVRERLAALVKEANNGFENELWLALRSEPSDDMSEEDEAIDFINEKSCDDYVRFTFEDGDLVLVRSDLDF